MFDVFLEKVSAFIKSRLLPVSLIYITLFSILIFRLFHLQIVEGEQYESKLTTRTQKERQIQGTRGNIYDAKGKLLAYNELTYSVTLLDTGEVTDGQKLNEMIYKVIQIIESNGDSLDIDFGLLMDDKGNITFRDSGNSLLRFKRDVYAKTKVDELTEEQVNSTAEEVFEYLRSSTDSSSLKFKIADTYSKEDAYKIMAVRFARYLNSTRYLPITIAKNVSQETVAAIKESSGDIPGLDITLETTRVYDPSIAVSMAHVLGYTGSISDEAWESMSEEEKKIYTPNDQIGKTGIEAEFEEYLHGTSGYDNVTLNQSNRIVEVTKGKDPVAGNDIYLTIDSDLQNACYELIEKELAGILLDKIHPNENRTVVKSGKTEIVIPIKDVYFALIDNNVIDIEAFEEEDATTLEKKVYETFVSERSKVFNELENILAYNSKQKDSSLSEDNKEYTQYIYSMLISDKYLSITDEIKASTVYNDYKDGKVSLSEFLQYALSQEWIDRTQFSDAGTYYESEEIYNLFLKFILEKLSEDKAFGKMIYERLIYNGKVTGTQICLLLFDQNVLNYDKDAISSLKNGGSPYKFIREKIKNLEITPGQLALEPCSGSIVITDTDTGKVKALVTYPSYDNNKLANKVDSEYYEYLTENKAYPLINRPLQQKTAPGSTYKMLSSIVGLQEGALSSTSEKIHDGTVFDKIKPVARCWAPHSHGDVNVSEALEVSCNYFFYEVGFRLGQRGDGTTNESITLSKLESYAKLFGLGEVSGIELSSEYKPKISDSQGVRSMIGQGTNNYTPANLSKYVTGIVNNGTVYNLSIMDKIVDVSGEVVKSYAPTVYENEDSDKSLQDVRTEYWNAVKEGMYLVVNGSRSSIDTLFKDLDFKVAGKTGTAQENLNKPNHALFVSYAPYDNPEITVTTVIPNGYTSSNAAELTRDVYKYYFYEEDRQNLLDGEVSAPEIQGSSSED